MAIASAFTGTGGVDPTIGTRVRSRRAMCGSAIIMVGLAILVGGCSIGSQPVSAPRSSQAKPPVTIGGGTAASRYLVIAIAGNNQLEIDFDQLSGRDRNRLSNALADLSDASATERLFDRCLLMIAFPSFIKMVVDDLYTVNESRADLTASAAMSSTLGQLRNYESRLSAANEPVEHYVGLIRSSLHLPPPTTS